VKKARKEIDEAYKSWFKMKNYWLGLELFVEYNELTRKIDKLDEKKKEIGLQIQKMLETGNIKTMNVDWIGKFTLGSTKTYIYPEDWNFKEIKEEYTLKKKEIEKELLESWSFTEAVSLRFTKEK
jgi:hypothetical protein